MSARRFVVGRVPFSNHLAGPVVRLPMDWAQDPHSSRSWRLELHTLQWLQTQELADACAIAHDWLAANPQGAPTSDLAWVDMAIARRGPWLAHLAAAGSAAGVIGSDGAQTLRDGAIAHARWLADDTNYRQDNHGAYQDEALLLLAGGNLADHPDAKCWEAHARGRLAANLANSVDLDSGLHLEHSPGYQFTIIHMLERLVDLAPEHAKLLDRMRAAAGWLVTPDRRLAQLGDTHATRYPRWVVSPDGVRRFPGLAAVRRGRSFLLVTCGHHSPIHKHADDGSFVWFENGDQLICDTGAYVYDAADPLRAFAISADAHNTLTLDGRDFGYRVRRPYGDGIRGIARDGEDVLITVSHPHLQVASHRRRFRYRPGRLVIEDDLRATEPHVYTRRFHVPQGAQVLIHDESGAQVEHRTFEGWRSPSFRERQPTTVHELLCYAQDVTLTTALSISTALRAS